MAEVEKFNINKKTIGYSFIVQIFQYGTSILILPVVLRMLSTQTMGVWYIFISVSSIAALVDFGFSTSLSRNITYVFSGASSLYKNGVPSMDKKGEVNYKLLFDLISTSKRTYGIISVLMFLFLAIAGTPYIIHATQDSGIDDIIVIWLFFSVSTAINYYYNYVIIFLRGRGRISQCNNVIIISKVIYILFVYILICCGFNLWALVIANVASAFIGRVIGNIYFWDKYLIDRFDEYKVNVTNKENLFSVIWYNAKKFGISSFTNYAFSQANVLLGGLFLTIEEVAKLGLAMQLFQVLMTICRVSFNTYYPKICGLWVEYHLPDIRKIFLRSQMVGYFFWFIGFFTITVLGNKILYLIGSKTFLPTTGVILMYAFFYLMELTHGNCSMLISSRNEVPFLKASVFACVISVAMMFIFASLGLGIYSFPLAMILANLPYNSWKWPYEAYRLLYNSQPLKLTMN